MGNAKATHISFYVFVWQLGQIIFSFINVSKPNFPIRTHRNPDTWFLFTIWRDQFVVQKKITVSNETECTADPKRYAKLNRHYQCFGRHVTGTDWYILGEQFFLSLLLITTAILFIFRSENSKSNSNNVVELLV